MYMKAKSNTGLRVSRHVERKKPAMSAQTPKTNKPKRQPEPPRKRQFTSITSKADPFVVVYDPRHDWDDLPF